MRGGLLIALTLLAFAANSVLCRTALGGHHIDPVSFTIVRLASGALALALICRLTAQDNSTTQNVCSWGSSLALCVYAASFSLSYISLAAGTGALILFGSVQLTMIGYALWSGEYLEFRQWAGLGLAAAGLIYLVKPGLSAPDPAGALLMFSAGIAWGMYSIRGKHSPAAIAMTACNFARSVPLALILLFFSFRSVQLEAPGIMLALISGAVTSGIGYVLWYKALPLLTTTQASILQLTVPILAGFGGVLFLSEQIPMRLVAASPLVLGGVALAAISQK
jgi:drug/metabolite transporter (DMT)-like permease